MSITTLELKQKSKTNLSPCEYDITVLRVDRARNSYVIIEYAVNIEDHPDDTNYLVVPIKDYDQKEKSFRDYAENHSFFSANLEDSILWLTACHFLWQEDFITAANDDIK